MRKAADPESYEDALNKAHYLLSFRFHSASELSRKLRLRGFLKSTVDKALENLASLGYLDDEKFAKSFVEEKFYKRGMGPAKIRMESRKRGIPREIAEKEIERIIEKEAEKALEIAEVLKNKKGKTARQAMNFLLGRGYSSGSVKAAIEEIYYIHVLPHEKIVPK